MIVKAKIKNKAKSCYVFFVKESAFDSKPHKLLVFFKIDNLNYICIIF